MKLKFKKQTYQTLATEAVVDCLKGQPNTSGINYRIDPGVRYKDSKGYSTILFPISVNNMIDKYISHS